MIKTILSLPSNQPTGDKLLQQLEDLAFFCLPPLRNLRHSQSDGPDDHLATNSVDSRSPKEWIRAARPTGQTSGEGILARLKIAR